MKKFKEWTHKWKAIQIMLKNPTKWRAAEDFMQYTLPRRLFIGYRAAASLWVLEKLWICEWVAVENPNAPCKWIFKKRNWRLTEKAAKYYKELYKKEENFITKWFR